MAGFTINKIIEGDFSTMIGMNGGCPESPDGKRLVYARKKKIDGSDSETEIWVCDKDFTNHRLVFTTLCGNHNGPSQTFIDNSRIVFRGTADNGKGAFFILNVDTCEVVFGPVFAKESHNAESMKYPFSLSDEQVKLNPDHPEIDSEGVYELDCQTYKIRKLFDSELILDSLREMGYTPNDNTKKMSHVQFNPSATCVMMRLSIDDCPIFGALGCVELATKKFFLIPNKPVHQLWFDDETYMATYQEHDGKRYIMETSRIKRYTRDGKVVEVLGGVGNHIDASPDRRYVTGDTIYPDCDTAVYLYKRGSVEPLAMLDCHNFEKVKSDLKIHSNPTFSRDGKRIYFNRPVAEDKTEVFVADISGLVE